MSKENEDELRDEIIQMKMEIEKCKQTKIALKDSEERFRAFAESAIDGIVTTDENGNILYFNSVFEKQFGYTAEELTGQNLTILMPEKYRKDYLNELEEYKKTGKHRLLGKTVETTGLRKDGTLFPFEMSLSSWKSGDKTYFSDIIRDVSERKKVQEALKKSEERFRTFAETAVDGIVTTDDKGKILFFNRVMESLFGYKASELTGQSLTTLMPIEYRENYLEELERYKTTGEHNLLGRTVQTTGLRKDGSIFPFEMTLATWKSGDTTYFSAIIRDLTEIRKAEEELKKKYRSIIDKFLNISNQILREMSQP